MLEAPDTLKLVTRLNVAVFSRQTNGRFTLEGTPPAWLRSVWPGLQANASGLQPSEHLTYLDHFIAYDAEAFWTQANEQDTPLTSNPWTESLPDGSELLLQAVALVSTGTPLLLLKFAETPPDRLRQILQESRSQGLELHRLIKEINKRELLLHCIVHDLSTPLAGIRASLSLLHEDQLIDQEGEPLFRIAQNQVDKMREQIQHVLHSYTRNTQPLLPALSQGNHAPDLASIAHDVVTLVQPVADANGVELHMMRGYLQRLPVIAEATKLERVLFNLIDNAIRYSPEDGSVQLRLLASDHHAILDVLDDGPGVAPDLVPSLFNKFAQGEINNGQVGLGLYFCRITVEDWGGSITYIPRPEGGSCFRLRLQRPSAQDEAS